MEKLVYVLWAPENVSPEGFRRDLLGACAPKLLELGPRGLSVNLADESVAHARGLRITQRQDRISGTLSIWLDAARDRSPVERVLATAVARFAGYLVLESVPLVNRTHLALPGERTPGFTSVAFLELPGAMAYDTWLERWQGDHTAVAIETQSTFLYIQNVIVRPLTRGAPPWTAIVEEGFPDEAATDPMVFYAAGGSREKLEANQRRMLESCRRFIDFARLEVHPMSTYVLR